MFGRIGSSFRALVILCTAAMVACSQEGGRAAYPERFGVKIASPATSVAVTPALPLRIVGYGPHGTHRGQPFNIQPDGASALWVKLSSPVDASVTRVILAGKPLVTTTQSTTITAVVPLEIVSVSGKLKLFVTTRGPSGELVQSDDVFFDVR